MKPGHRGFHLRSVGQALAAVLAFIAQPVLAADADNGKRLAQLRCSPCHIVAPGQRQEVADSPPFEIIAGKLGFDASAIAASVLDPHPRMNMTLTRREAEDIAAYMATLGK